ncbi:MAG: DUF2339 domain-containing protein [Candidatus Acinetobacter avistercoris]|uniref:DUF2339 domain-containing protein n=1 Tax=Acinetobacter sp. KS-LM10 TaxID=3120518 RepID=UPI001F952F09|nr:DUF2339 domain-containing protein [Candidatus Acinetobacter avistercoris]
MLKQHSEIRMIWLMVLIIAAVGAWFLKLPILTFLCAIAFVLSVMQYVDAIEKPVHDIAAKSQSVFEPTSKVPLYLSSVIAVIGSILGWYVLVGLAASSWIFFFLRWLQKLERNLNQIQINQNIINTHGIVSNNENLTNLPIMAADPVSEKSELNFIDQIKSWIFYGNPVLKVAIIVLVIGVILLLRFATEHWQLSLSLKLAIVALLSFVTTVFGMTFQNKNRSFALALEGLGLAGLFLTLFFGYYNQVIPSLAVAALCYAVIMSGTLLLSLRQQSVELALMAMLIAYIAPFTLPVRDATAVELIAYYLVINVAIAILSTLRPWKMLNQIAFLATTLIGGAYAFIYGYVQEQKTLTVLLLEHTAIFIWLGFRFSQLLAKKDVAQLGLKPVLDVALIFSAPIVGYLFIYLMYFEDTAWQAGMSLGFAVVFAVLYQLAKRNQSIALISQSYLSLSLIFLALIPPILLSEEWSVTGWAVEGVLIFIFALYKRSNISRYLAMGLLIVAGLSSTYYLVESAVFPSTMYWILSLSYLLVVVIANAHADFRRQLPLPSVIFLSALSISASTILIILGLDLFDGVLQSVLSLLLLSLTYFTINEVLLARNAKWTWLLPKWFGLIPLIFFAFSIVLTHVGQGVLQWDSISERIIFAISGLVLTVLWLRPVLGESSEREWISLGIFISLGLTSLTLLPNMPYISVVILPLLLCIWSRFYSTHQASALLWQSKSTIGLMVIWMICSQLFSMQAFQGYLLPVLNPFDLVSLAMLMLFIAMLSVQLKTGLDRSIVAILMVLSLLWLSSYIILRSLHIYFATPYNDLLIWENALVQLSLTLLWVSLAFFTMSFATRKRIRSMWILGASILLIVTLKLVLLDLSHVGTLTRVISFLGAGFVMLIIAYIAPMPETEKALDH